MTVRATPTVQIDNSDVRVTQWRLPPQSAIGFHRHDLDYVVVPMTDGEMTLTGPDGGRTIAKLTVGQSYFRKAGVEHDVGNDTATEIVFLEIEIKR
jgi:quercetin dioxygenase-like cupin family protein